MARPPVGSVTPMMQQYLAIKEQHPDELLFYRLGDFYEMFFDDALTASRELELTLTGRDCGLPERAPMCGVPYHAVDTYITRLIEKGYRVAICEQMEDPALAKGLVKREITRIVTPGTVTDQSALSERQNNFLASVCIEGKRAGLAYTDVTTGEFYVRQLSNEERELRGALAAIAPREIITNAPDTVHPLSEASIGSCPQTAFRGANASDMLCEHFGVNSLTALGLDATLLPAAHAAGALMRYLSETQKNAMTHITALRILSENQTMPLDAATRRNLELTEGLHSRTTRGSLLWLLDKTATAMGGRLLRRWVEQPLLSRAAIEQRLNAVSALYDNHVLSERLYDILRNVYDMERILSKVSYNTLNARDCLALLRSLKQVPPLQALLADDACAPVCAALGDLDPLSGLAQLLENAINPDAPLQITEGAVIREGYNAQLDELRQATTQGKQWLSDLEAKEREETGIKTLRIQYNRVFGYYIEVTKSYYNLVPLRYQRRQTLASSERFTTDELRQIESKITGAQEQSTRLELELFYAIRSEIAAAMPRLQGTANALKTLDALLSLARVARESNYVRPTLTDDGTLTIHDGRHPVVERMLSDNLFVPNDTEMNDGNLRMQIITGPNMAGKSTYMRQVALIVLMAHMGSFVPAREAAISLVDNVYTRVGASDDLAGGQSTFMVEMSETAYILRNATARSLVILDEIGRGTSTFDGMSIARSVVEFICENIGCKTLFATHYHELTSMEQDIHGVKNYNIAVKKRGEDITFLRRIVAGPADDSYGIEVAKLAGLPGSVAYNNPSVPSEVVEKLHNVDIETLTPLEALNFLYELKNTLDKD